MSKELATIDHIVNESSSKFVSTLAQYQWDVLPDSQLQAAKQALTKNDYITKIACNDPVAVHDALIKSAVLGLDLTEGKRQGWLLPRKNQQGKTVVVLQVGYKGVEAIHQRMGVIDRLVIRTVRENDAFEWSGDDQEKPKHEAEWFQTDEERGPPKGAYAITYYPDGSINVVVTAISVIYEKHRDRSDSWKSYCAKKAKGEYAHPPPWVSDENAMIEKTMAFIASKQWPANIRDEGMSSKILETLHQVDMSDYSIYTPEQKEAFYSFFNAEDALGMHLFSRRVDIEVLTGLFNSFEKGKKTSSKQKVRDMDNIGFQQFTNIILALNENDEFSLRENLHGSIDLTYKLLKTQLNAVQKSTFNEMITVIDGEVSEPKTEQEPIDGHTLDDGGSSGIEAVQDEDKPVDGQGDMQGL